MPSGGWNYSNMPVPDGFQNHHVIPKSLKTGARPHELLKMIDYDVDKPSSLIYLPKEFGDYGSRSSHKGYSGDHAKYNAMMSQRLDDILEAGKAGNWSKQKFTDAVEKLRKDTRKGLRNGTIKCR